jgi:hypothetical protein
MSVSTPPHARHIFGLLFDDYRTYVRICQGVVGVFSHPFPYMLDSLMQQDVSIAATAGDRASSAPSLDDLGETARRLRTIGLRTRSIERGI